MRPLIKIYIFDSVSNNVVKRRIMDLTMQNSGCRFVVVLLVFIYFFFFFGGGGGRGGVLVCLVLAGDENYNIKL